MVPPGSVGDSYHCDTAAISYVGRVHSTSSVEGRDGTLSAGVFVFQGHLCSSNFWFVLSLELYRKYFGQPLPFPFLGITHDVNRPSLRFCL